MTELFKNWLHTTGLSEGVCDILAKAIGVLVIVFIGFVVHKVTRKFVLPRIYRITDKSQYTWDNTLRNHGFFNQLAKLAPVVVIYTLLPIAFDEHSRLLFYGQKVLVIYAIILSIFIVDAFLNGSHEIYNTYSVSRKIPIKSFIQVTKLGYFIICVIFIISLLFNKTPVYFISGLGAMTAVIMFIFKDAILGFIAGIQLTANKMVVLGDWVELPKYGADGDVIEVGLTTVKVQNWDKTVTMIPTYALISESFKNWRGMQESGGRRIKRAIYIDLNSVKFCNDEMIDRFQKIQYIADYIKTKKTELEDHNKRVDGSHQINRRRLTNIGILRAYLNNYLKNHPKVNADMTFMIRQLQPTEVGLPLEIYLFCRETAWTVYESIQADIFDHILAIIPEFDLRIFQNPTGSDFASLANGNRPPGQSSDAIGWNNGR